MAVQVYVYFGSQFLNASHVQGFRVRKDLPSAMLGTSLYALPSLLGLDTDTSVFSYTGDTLYRTCENQAGAACRIAGTFLPWQ